MVDNTPIKFDADSLKKRVSESVQATFAGLIPDDVWANMVETEVKAFFEGETKFTLTESSYGRSSELQASMTPFRQVVWERCNQLVRSKLKAILDSKLLQVVVDTAWDQDTQRQEQTIVALDASVQALTERMAPMLVNTMFQNIVAEAVVRSKAVTYQMLTDAIKQP